MSAVDVIKKDIAKAKKLRDYLNINSKIDDLADEAADIKRINIFTLRSFTIENVVPVLKAKCFASDILAQITLGGFNQYLQYVLNDTSELYASRPDIVIIALRLEDMAPKLFESSILEKDVLSFIESEVLNTIEAIVKSIKQKTASHIIINNFAMPEFPGAGIYDYQTKSSLLNFVRNINLKLLDLKEIYPGVYINDVDYMVTKKGLDNLLDRKMWYVAKNPYNSNYYLGLAEEYAKIIRAIYGMAKKCIVLDLDNTLWGGIVGEDGFNGIKLGESYPGKCYKDFQRELLKLTQRGIILAVNSKNNCDDAMEVINGHPDMVLREENFACIKINWNDKATNILDISRELNIGLDSMVFIDDNPVECELVKERLPMVMTYLMPDDPTLFVDFARSIGCFEKLDITEEDLNRTNMYRAQIKRASLQSQFESLDDFYRNLDMVITVKGASDFYIPRISQLTQRTNQFNLTTRRYTEEDVRSMTKDGRHLIYAFDVKDKFGDYGIVGLVIIEELNDKEWFVDTFLLSCRVMNRKVEDAMMAFVCEQALKSGIETVWGEYIPTKKILPAMDFYKNLGFTEKAGKYFLNIKESRIFCPDYFKMNVEV
jgi:FkbH-like protein